VCGNRILVYFDLDKLFCEAESIRRRSLNGPLHPRPANKLADLVFSQAFPLALHHIRTYDWQAEREQYTRLKLASRDRLLSEWDKAVRVNEEAIQDKVWEVESLTRKNAELRARIRTSRMVVRRRLERDAVEEHVQLVQLLGRSLRSIRHDDGKLQVVTMPIAIDYEGHTYEFGCFRLEIPQGNGRLVILGEEPDRKVEGYSHPHLATDGTPCLGNIGTRVAQLLGDGQVVPVVILLLEFLRSYNPDNPYLRIEKWDPDWEEDDEKYESCYQNASLRDCAICTDDACPYQEDGSRRCYEEADTRECIACGRCSMHEDAIETCRDSHEPWECVQCDDRCQWAGDADACHDSAEAGYCAGCPHEECDYHHEEENDEDEHGEVPAVSAAGR
jgi:hypothetical protein